MNIEILGAKDAQTDRVVENVKTALQKIQLFAKIKLVTDPIKISSYGPMMLPAVVINGQVKINGRVPHENEIIKMIQREGGR
ncbi:MAG: thioredoxin family protein [Firmicutes bacterium]|nr:thioredoxin family protein [Bacillota bacterium]